MSTVREQVLVRVETLLGAASVGVHPEWEKVDKDIPSGIIFGDFVDTATEHNTVDKHSLSMPMGFFARGENARATADGIQDEVYQLLKNDSVLAGLVKRLIPGPVQGGGSATGGNAAMLSQTWIAEFFTETGTQTVPV